MPPTPHPFLLGGVREGFGNALILEGSSKDASPAVRRVFYMVSEALGGAHHEHQSTSEAHREGSGIASVIL